MADKVDIRIMAHPARKANVQLLLKELSLPESAVTWDDRKEGGDALYTARKAWLSPWPVGYTHRVVLADDAEVCVGFRKIVEILAQTHPNDVYTLFQRQEANTDAPVANVCSKMVFGVGVMLPRGIIKPIFESPMRAEDDMSVTFWVCQSPEAQKLGTRVLTPIPSIVQHLPMKSLLGNPEGITSPTFVKRPQKNWASTEVIDIF